MASTRFSAGLVSLYPRESDELQLLLDRHNVPHGRPDAVLSFPAALTSHPALREDLGDFVERSRNNPRGPVSRSAVLHLLLTGIGGPEAVELGPEADSATHVLTGFLERLGRWPEDAFADVESPGSEDGFTSRPASPPASPERRTRSLGSSLASHTGYAPREERSELPGATLQEILLALQRLEDTQRTTGILLDQIDGRLRQMEDRGAEPDLFDASSAANEPDMTDVADFPVGAKTIIPTPILSQLSAQPEDAPVLTGSTARGGAHAVPPLPAKPEIAMDAAAPAVSQTAPSPAVAETPLIAPRPSPPALAEPPVAEKSATRASVSPAPEWKSMFAESQPKPQRRVAVLPVAIACLILAAAIVAGIIYFLHNEGAAPSPASSNSAVLPAPPLSDSGSEPGAGEAAAPRAGNARNGSVSREIARNAAPPVTGERQDRVLGARETYQPHSSAEIYPQPRQPGFVAASVMESRLVYAPPPQHPRVAGLVGLTGMVVLEVTVDADGTVDTVKVLGGHHLLRDAAVNAVRTWRYRPVLQNGRPVPVRTIIRLDFSKQSASQAANNSQNR